MNSLWPVNNPIQIAVNIIYAKSMNKENWIFSKIPWPTLKCNHASLLAQTGLINGGTKT